MEKKKKYLIIGILAIIVIAVIVILALVLNNQNQKVEQEEQEQNNTIDYNEINLNDMGILDNVEVKGNGNIKSNTSETLLAERTFNGLTIKNISLESNKGTTTFKATVINNSENIYPAKEVKITLLDKDGQEYGILNALIEEIQPGGERVIDASTNVDLSNAYNFKIEENIK